MLMRLLRHRTSCFNRLLFNMSTEVEICLVTEEKSAQETWVVIDPFAETLAKFTALVLVGLALSLKNLYFVWKQFQVAMTNSHHRTPGDPHFR